MVFFSASPQHLSSERCNFLFHGWREGDWEISCLSAKTANNLHKSEQGIATEVQSLYPQTVLCFSYLRKSSGEAGLVLYCFDFPYLSPLLFVSIVDCWGGDAFYYSFT